MADRKLSDVLTEDFDYNITQPLYGANLRRFFKKARDYRAGRLFAEAPVIIMMGDSITSGSWAEDFKTYLCAAYGIPTDNFSVHGYGGYDIQMMLPFIEDTLIYPNPDLILFGEYEAFTGVGDRPFTIESLVSLFRERTTADIGIYTWSMSKTVAEAYELDSTTLIDNAEYEQFNWYRDIAGIYNCELIDFNAALKEAIDRGCEIDSVWSSGPHLSDFGYETVFLPEIKKHFPLSDNQSRLNIPYPLYKKEETIFLTNAIKMDLFSYPNNITTTGTWLVDENLSLYSRTVSDTVEIEMNDIIGFEIQHEIQNNATILLKEVGGEYAQPSTFQYNSRPLQYITEIKSLTYPDDWGVWRFKRPFTKGIVTANELSDGTLTSGQYKIVVNSVVGEVITCEMFNPSSVSMGTFTVGQEETLTSGNLSFPQKYNGENNYRTGAAIAEGDEYEFYIKNNWCNSLSAGEGTDKVFGLRRGDYVVKLTVSSVTGVNLYNIKLLH